MISRALIKAEFDCSSLVDGDVADPSGRVLQDIEIEIIDHLESLGLTDVEVLFPELDGQ